jgi:hypothetical protein
MSSYFDKLSEYYRSEQADKDNKRFIKQVKHSYISAAIIMGIMFLLIIITTLIAGIESIFR